MFNPFPVKAKVVPPANPVESPEEMVNYSIVKVTLEAGPTQAPAPLSVQAAN